MTLVLWLSVLAGWVQAEWRAPFAPLGESPTLPSVPAGCPPFERWKQPGPSPEGEERGECIWRVHDEGGRAAVSLAREEEPLLPVPARRLRSPDDGAWGTPRAFEVDDGWLASVDAGEWGGGVFWIARDGGRVRRLSGESAGRVARTRYGLVVPTGSCHGFGKDARLLVVERGPSGWVARPLATVKGLCGPIAIGDAPGGLVVTDGRAVARIRFSGKSTNTELLTTVPRDMTTSSIVQVGGDIFLGGHTVRRLHRSASGFQVTEHEAPTCLSESLVGRGAGCACARQGG